MNPQDLLTLLEEWVNGTIPGEILCDAMIDAELNPDSFLNSDIINYETFRMHFCRLCLNVNIRTGCNAAFKLRQILLGKLPCQPATGHLTS